MYINGEEEESETLIDDDADTCVNLTGSNGCTMDRVWNLYCLGSNWLVVESVHNYYNRLRLQSVSNVLVTIGRA